MQCERNVNAMQCVKAMQFMATGIQPLCHGNAFLSSTLSIFQLSPGLDCFAIALEESLKVGSVKWNQKVFSSERHTLRIVPIHLPLLLMADFILHLVSTTLLQENQELELLQNSWAANIPDPCLAVALYDVWQGLTRWPFVSSCWPCLLQPYP